MIRKKLFMLFVVVVVTMKGYAQYFDVRCKELTKSMVEAVDKDVRTFDREIEKIEMQIAALDRKQNPDAEVVTQKAVLHCIAAWAYDELPDRYSDRRNDDVDYISKSREHLDAAMSDKLSLAKESAMRYQALVNIGINGIMFNHSMLAVVADFYMQRAGYTEDEKRKLYAEMIDVYRQLSLSEASSTLEDELRYMNIMRSSSYVHYGYGAVDNISQRDSVVAYWKRIVAENRDSRFIDEYQSRLDDVLRPCVSIITSQDIYPADSIELNVHYWNCDNASVTVRQFNGYKKGKYEWQRELRLDGKVVAQVNLSLGKDSYNLERQKSGLPVAGKYKHKMTGLPTGRYVIVYKSLGNQDEQVVDVSTVRMVAVSEDDGVRIFTLDARNGQPIGGVPVNVEFSSYSRNNKKPQTSVITTDSRGEALYLCRNMGFVRFKAVRTPSDSIVLEHNVSDNLYVNNAPVQIRTSLFTDRFLYRPGQKVRVAGMFYRSEAKDSYAPVVSHTADVIFRFSDDSKNKNTVHVTSNDYGSFDCEFSVPADAKVGTYVISCGNSRVEIRVEEYKRPTWELTLRGVGEGKLAVGDTMTVEGSARMYSGVAVPNAKVEYEILSSEHSNWWFRSWRHLGRWQWNSESHGTAVADGEGRFRIMLPLVCRQRTDAELIGFKVVTKVTDMAGETHEEEFYTSVSRRDFALSADADEVIDLSAETTLTVSAADVLGNKLDVRGTYEVVLNGDTLAIGDFESNHPYTLSSLCRLSAAAMDMGDYYVSFRSRDSKGNDIVLSQPLHIRVFDSNLKTAAKRKALFTDDFLYCADTKIKVGESARVFYCPAAADSYVVRYVSNGKRVFSRSAQSMGKALTLFEVKYDTVMHDGASVSYFYVKNAKLNKKSLKLTLKTPDKRLMLAWKTFRDHVQPGNREQWTLTVKSPDGKAVNASELFATMYDASLDALQPFNWHFSLDFYRQVGNIGCYFSSLENAYRVDISGGYKDRKFTEYVFDQFRDFYSFGNSRGNRRSRGILREVAVGRQSAKAVNMEEHAAVECVDALQGRVAGLDLKAAKQRNVNLTAMNTDAGALDMEEVEEAVVESVIDETDGSNVQLRTDFAEIAFFFPHLLTDKNGEVQISFTLPESLTEWKFIGLAHDRQLNYGVITSKTVAQKPFMVQPQMPRFVRVGDELNIATRIINQGSAELKGKAVVRILNAKTEKLIYIATQPFAVEASGTVAVTFPYTVKSGEDDLVCELTAVSGDNSDGERNLIPVLPSRMMVTESVPFYMENSGEKSIDLSALYNGNSPSAADKTMTLEYTDNPVWMVIDALRTVQTPSSNSAPSLAAALYANSRLCELAEFLRSYTDKQVVNVDSARARYDKALKLLEDLQCNDGSFRWFDGFERGNYYVTLLVAEHLSRMTDKPEMLAPALSYLDSVQVRNYEYCKANKMEIVPSESDLHYLLVCSRLPQRKVSTKAQKVRNIYLDYVEKNQKELSIYGVSVSSVILRSFSRRSGADKLLNVVRHYLVNDEGQGLHFATKRALYSWYDYRIPTQVAAMQALYDANPADAALKDMQLWLLRQKQVQAWDCAENTCDVADLFLRISPLTSLRNGEKAHFAINGKNVVDRTPADDSVYFAHEMGYVNTPVEADIYSQPVSTLNVSKTSEGISWGAVIVSFTDESSRMKAYSIGEVSISRRILVSEVDKEGKQSWRTLNAGETLRVGQKVRVRHTLKADRDMDFVCVKTLHPACFEPVEHISGYRCKGTEWCYQSIHDSYMELFFEKYREGTSTIDVDYYVTRPGVYNMGITSAECTYAKMFGGHSDGMTVSVVEK